MAASTLFVLLVFNLTAIFLTLAVQTRLPGDNGLQRKKILDDSSEPSLTE